MPRSLARLVPDFLTDSQSTDFPTASAFQPAHGGDYDVFVTKVNVNGSLGWSTFLGKSLSDVSNAITVDAVGNPIVIGSTENSSFPTTAGAFQVRHTLSARNVFVTKFTANGSALLWSTFLAGSGPTAAEHGGDVAVGSDGDVYVCGISYSRNFPVRDAFQPAFGGGDADGFITRLRHDGSALVWSSYFGGLKSDSLGSIALDGVGHVYAAGGTNGGGPLPGGVQMTYGGGEWDAILLRLEPPRPIGAACTIGNQCTTGNCASGVCCDTACTGACSACAVARGAVADGTCSPLPSTTQCRAPAGFCDQAEFCDGTSLFCPVDGRTTANTPCPDDGNPCTLDICDGTRVTCEHPVGNAGARCRAPADECDAAEACTGTSATCPEDRKRIPGAGCSDDGLACTVDVCDGFSDACQHAAGNAGATCRAAVDACDVAETCSGTDPECPDDVRQEPSECSAPDAGSPSVDAGTVAPDAGTGGELPPPAGCGCGSSPAGALLSLSVLLLALRRRAFA